MEVHIGGKVAYWAERGECGCHAIFRLFGQFSRILRTFIINTIIKRYGIITIINVYQRFYYWKTVNIMKVLCASYTASSISRCSCLHFHLDPAVFSPASPFIPRTSLSVIRHIILNLHQQQYSSHGATRCHSNWCRCTKLCYIIAHWSCHSECSMRVILCNIGHPGTRVTPFICMWPPTSTLSTTKNLWLYYLHCHSFAAWWGLSEVIYCKPPSVIAG